METRLSAEQVQSGLTDLTGLGRALLGKQVYNLEPHPVRRIMRKLFEED